MMAEPLRSALAIGNMEDTSLALPSDTKLRLGQQRVLDQVHTLKRSKSKQGKNGSLSLSPTSPSPKGLTVFDGFGTFRMPSSPTKATFNRNVSNVTSHFNKSVNIQKSRSLSTKSMGRRNVSTSSQWDQRFNTANWPTTPNGLKPSRSDPNLTPAFGPASTGTMRAKGQTSQVSLSRSNRNSAYATSNGNVQTVTTTTTRIIRPPSAQSHHESKASFTKTTKTEGQQIVNGGFNMSDLTLKEAVEFLSSPEENYQQCGASFIQHSTFNDEPSKQQVLNLGGIPLLVALLRSPNADVSQTAAAALRNLVFKDQANKEEVQHCGGIEQALQLLKETDSTETLKQLTGLLWNISSYDCLKGELTSTALSVLTDSVVVPFTCWSDSSANNNIHPDVFYNATGCLRNLSSAKVTERQAMRECPGLIDSIMMYVQSCVAEDNPDDKSMENCTCILHNLTYQLELESPRCLDKYKVQTVGSSGGRTSPTVGCFSPRSSKIQKENLFDVVDGSAPSGVDWLCHPKFIHIILSVMGASQKDTTLEACCGALQNLTAHKGEICNVMSQTMVQKIGAVQSVIPLLHSGNPNLQRTATALVINLSRSGISQNSLARQLLPDLASLLSSGAKAMSNNDDTIANTCNAVRSFLPVDPEGSRKVTTSELVNSVATLSENGAFPKGSRAASVLLYSLWNDKNLQGNIKKLGLGKPFFINDITTAAHKSLQVLD